MSYGPHLGRRDKLKTGTRSHECDLDPLREEYPRNDPHLCWPSQRCSKVTYMVITSVAENLQERAVCCFLEGNPALLISRFTSLSSGFIYVYIR